MLPKPGPGDRGDTALVDDELPGRRHGGLPRLFGRWYRYLIEAGGEPAGAVSIRHPWLKGPYLELLALLPLFQNQGIGAEILGWFEGEGLRAEARNLWVCASGFNERALHFYQRHGFSQAAALPGLVADGYTEILLRKFPL